MNASCRLAATANIVFQRYDKAAQGFLDVTYGLTRGIVKDPNVNIFCSGNRKFAEGPRDLPANVVHRPHDARAGSRGA
jgi:hypothetical protein